MEWEPPSVEQLQELLPQYQISGFLGRGGMGAVYRGKQSELDRDVAIKILPESVAGDDSGFQFAERFRQEARAMAKLMHPQIVSVFDFGQTEEGQLFFAMEFIDGVDIQTYIGQHGGRVPPKDAVSILTHVLVGLAFAHVNGILHRDIKPANILIDRRSQVKVADFGLAKRFEDDGMSTPTLTMTDATVGTPDFVAPEALQKGALVDHRADLYAVGVMFYQMLTGVVPRGAWKPATRLVSGLDSRYDAVIEKAMDPDPEGRYQSADEMRFALLELLKAVEGEGEVAAEIEELPTRVISTGRGKKVPAEEKVGEKKLRWVPVVAGALGLVVAVVLGFVFWPGEREGRDGGGTDGDPVVESGSPFPLKRPLVPTRPTVECRLLMVQPAHITETIEDPLAEKIGELDLPNIVDFDTPPEFGRLSVRILLSDGDLRGWSNLIQQGELEAMELPKTGDGISIGGDHGVLREGGRIYSGNLPDQFIGVPIVKTASAAHYSVALTETGRPFSYHQPAADPKMQAFEASIAGERGVVDIATFQGGHFGCTLLFEDGTIQQWRNLGEWTRREPKVEEEYSDVVKLGRRGYLLLRADGEIGVLLVNVGLGAGEINSAFAELKGQIAEIGYYNRAVVARTKSGQWILMDDIEKGGRRWKEAAEAIQGAVGVTIQENGLVYALLPKDEVPRSGFWKAEELIKARKETKETAAIFPLKTPPVPTRPKVEGRLVIVARPHITEEIADHFAEKIGELDLSNIVDFDTPWHHDTSRLTILLSEGELKGWEGWTGKNEWREVNIAKSKDGISAGADHGVLREGGRLYSGNLPAPFTGKPIVKTASNYHFSVALTESGRVFSFRKLAGDNPSQTAFASAIASERGVVDIATFSYKGFACNLLFENGTIQRWSAVGSRLLESEKPHVGVVGLGRRGDLVLYADGGIGDLTSRWRAGVLDNAFGEFRGQIEKIACFGSHIVAHTKSGEWILMSNVEHGGSRWAEIEEAVRGAVEVTIQQNGLVYALLPKDEVPRSGFWKAEELIAARKEIKETAGVFPLKPPPVPTRPEVECRLVMVPPDHVTDAVPGKLALKMAELDSSDIVEFQVRECDNAVYFLSADGAITGWDDGGAILKMRDGVPKSKDCVSVSSEMFLREGGRLYDVGATPAELIGEPVVRTAKHYQHRLALTAGGRVFATHGSVRGNPEESFQTDLSKLRGVVDVAARQYNGYATTILFADGSVHCWVSTSDGWKRDMKKEQRLQHVTRLGKMGRTAIHADGSVSAFHLAKGGKQFPAVLAPWKGKFEGIAAYGEDTIIARTSGGDWLLLDDIVGGGRLWGKAEAALRGAVDIVQRDDGLLYALLPKNEVPRSGIWKAEDLIAARKEIKGTAGVFPLKPPPLPTRPEVEGRMVMVAPSHIAEEVEDPFAEKIEELDLDDIVDFSAPYYHSYPEVTVLLADGGLKHWRTVNSSLEDVGVPKSRDCIALGNFLDPIRDGGRLYRGNIPEAFMGKPIVKTAGHQGRRFALTADGRVFRHEGYQRDVARDVAFSEALEGEMGVVDIAVRPDKNPGYTVLLDDGSIRYWGDWGEFKRHPEIEKSHTRVLRLDPQGHLLLYADGRVGSVFEHEAKHVAGIFAPWKGQITDIASFHHDHKFVVVARTKPGDWIIVDDIEHGGRRWEETEAAVRGARKVIAHQSGLVYALLPKDEVPRSGFWKAEELVKAREKPRGGEKAPIQEIAGGRGVPKFVVIDPEKARGIPDVPEAFDGVVAATLQPGHAGSGIAFLRADRSRWVPRDRGVSRRKGDAIAFFDAYFNGYLDDRGEIVLTNPPGTDSLRGSPIPKGPFRDAGSGNGFIGLLTEDGSVAVLADATQISENPLKRLQPPTGLDSVVQIDAGIRHFVARKADGSVLAWGTNVAGSCIVPQSLPPARSVGAVGNACIAIAESGQVAVWGAGLEESVREALQAIDDAEAVFTANAGGSPIAVRRKGKRWFLARTNEVIAPEIAEQLNGYDEVFLADDVAVGIHTLEE